MFGAQKKINELEMELRILKSTLKSEVEELRASLDNTRAMLAKIAQGQVLSPDDILAGKAYSDISTVDLEKMIGDQYETVVVDVRSNDEWTSGHIPHAIHISLDQLEAKIDLLKAHKKKPIHIICAAGGRSAAASAFLSSKGFSKVFNVTGGMGAYRGQVSLSK